MQLAFSFEVGQARSHALARPVSFVVIPHLAAVASAAPVAPRIPSCGQCGPSFVVILAHMWQSQRYCVCVSVGVSFEVGQAVL